MQKYFCDLQFLPSSGCEFAQTLCLPDKFLLTFSDPNEFSERLSSHTG